MDECGWLASNCELRHPVITSVDTHTRARCGRHHEIRIIQSSVTLRRGHTIEYKTYETEYLLMTSFDKCPPELRNLRFEIVRFSYIFYSHVRSPVFSNRRVLLQRSTNTDDVIVSDVTKVCRRFQGFSQL